MPQLTPPPTGRIPFAPNLTNGATTSIVDTICYHYTPTQMGQHTRISSASSSRIDQILASQDIAWRTRTHSAISSFSDHNMVIIQFSDSPINILINKDPVINTGHKCRVKPYMV